MALLGRHIEAAPQAALVGVSAQTEDQWRHEWAERPSLRGWQHAGAVIPAVAGGIAALCAAKTPRARFGAGAWGAGLVGMFGASATYHRLSRSRAQARTLRKIDHAAIYGALAGTWTPIALASLPGTEGVSVSLSMWALATVAAGNKVVRLDKNSHAGNWVYIAMGWASVALLPSMVHKLGWRTTGALIAGGGAYTLGAISFAMHKPNPSPGVYGYHEVWHTATLIGAGLHAYAVAKSIEALSAET